MSQHAVLDTWDITIIAVVTGREGVSENKILVETTMKWTDAQRYCRQYHTDLVSVRNLLDNQEIQSMVPPGKLAWIGLFTDTWKWSDGSISTFRYWLEGQPNSLEAGPNCAHVYGGKWSVRSCNTKSMFLCYCKYYTSLCKLLITA